MQQKCELLLNNYTFKDFLMLVYVYELNDL